MGSACRRIQQSAAAAVFMRTKNATPEGELRQGLADPEAPCCWAHKGTHDWQHMQTSRASSRAVASLNLLITQGDRHDSA